ncbi:MAG TPA: cation:proton antiporter [Hyphomicrobiaceae bacterium]|nr:cation:proton antiporter [Hyphomicrobiaceae bacterium]
MAATINMAAYSDALVVLGTAGVVVPLVKRFGISPVLAYLGAGALLGPLALGSFIGSFPILYWFTVVDAQNVAGIADLGVVFLLFLIGLELSYERLYAMRRLVFGLGGLQVLATTVVLSAVIALAGAKGTAAFILGSCLALSSTAIVLEVLSSQGRMPTSAGRSSFAVLLAQDLAVIPILMFVSIVGSNGGSSVLGTIGATIYHAVIAVAVIVLVGRTMLRPLFRIVVATQSSELFIATILFVIVATGVVAAAAELSMALGAFVAGLLLAETEYRKAIEATIEPFKGLLLGIFFFTVGMSIDPRELAREPLLLFLSVIGLIGLKAAIVLGLARLFRLTWPTSIETALLLGPGGEFAFVGIGLAATLGVVAKSTASFALAVTALTMVLIPALSYLGQRFGRRMEPPKPLDAALLAVPEQKDHHAIVVGYGRVGRVVSELLEEHSIAYTAVDHDPVSITRAKADGHPVYYGDATSEAFLKACGLMECSGVIITIHDQAMLDEIVLLIRRLRPDIMIVARAKDAVHAGHLYAIGVTDAVPETIEASLQLSEAALVGLGRQAGPVIASIHEHRDRVRQVLQQAASKAGAPQSRALRQKLPGKL